MTNTTMQFRLPDVETQREILTKKRDEYLAIAFNSDAEAEGLAVQTPSGQDVEIGEQNKKDMLANFRQAAENSRKSAARMQEMLDKLPKSTVTLSSAFLQ